MKNKYITKTNKLFYVLIIIFFICSIIIYASLNKNIKYLLLCNKELNTTYWKRPKITGWQISHFLSFSVAGIMVPRVYWILLVGVLWEFVEYILGVVLDKKDYWTSGGIDGQLKDIIMNCLGFLTGRYISLNVINV